MRYKYCSIPSCGEHATTKGKCSTHASHADALHHDKERAAIYTSRAWREFRLRRLALDPICQMCHEQSSTDVHHINPLRNPGAPVFTMEGTECCCHSCHSRVTWHELHQPKETRPAQVK